MIKKLEEKDIDEIMYIWKGGNLYNNFFIKEEYWANQYSSVKQLLLKNNTERCIQREKKSKVS